MTVPDRARQSGRSQSTEQAPWWSGLDAAVRAAVARWQVPGVDPDDVAEVVLRSLGEDLAVGRHPGVDVTTVATVPAGTRLRGEVVARDSGVLAGVTAAAAAFDAVAAWGGHTVEVRPLRQDGSPVRTGEAVLSVSGEAVALLTAERTALNLLCQLSGTATLTSRWVAEVAGTPAVVRDTRKTVPGMRQLQKHAVRCGGGQNHRMGLSDAALVKDNHVVAAGGVAAAFRAVRARFPDLPVEVECDTVDQVREAVAAGADLVLLDNMSPEELERAVQLARGMTPATVRLEASGGLDLRTARRVAETGVDYLAVGSLTHSAPALDMGFDLGPPEVE